MTKGVADISLDRNAERIEIYKLMVEMADRVSQRRQTANSFYLSINTLLIGGSAYLGTRSPALGANYLVAFSGIMTCLYWIKSIQSYKSLNTAKFAVIQEIEQQLLLQPYTDEWSKLDPDGDGSRHKPFHKIERTVPVVFLIIYVLLLAGSIPWRSHFTSLLC